MAVPYKNQMNQYKRMKIETASPEMLILMLYDGAIKNIKISIQSIRDEQPDFQQSSNCLIKAQNIITELMVSLNFEIGGDIARNLFNIYEYINYTMAQCNINKNDHNLDSIVEMLTDLRETWKEVIRINKEKYPNGIPRPTSPPPQGLPPAFEKQQSMQSSPKSEAEPVVEEPVEEQDSKSNETPAPQFNQNLNQNPQTTKQSNRFRQAYGKHMPSK
ncbi:MAG: flagellar export chaperone FliS [bacterium]|nr:flagellar export chaperone FliS [bacterium]